MITIPQLSKFTDGDNKLLQALIPLLIHGSFMVNSEARPLPGFGKVRFENRQLFMDVNIKGEITSILIGEVNNGK